ncbi:MAG: hypothetical protein JNL70_04785 [Saprospiraceae bacterium]|nr:hypothetical protein [Saprospiraceae bacterium]
MAVMSLKAQQAPIIVQTGTTSRIVPTLDSAVRSALNGDFIIIPGGTFRLSVPINKRLTIYGNGYRADSAGVSGVTTLLADYFVFSGSGVENTIISGIDFKGVVYLDGTPKSLTFNSCFFLGLISERINNPITNVNFKDCVFGWENYDRLYSANFTFDNCIMYSSSGFDCFYGCNQNFNNCVFNYRAPNSDLLFRIDGNSYVTVKNSILFYIFRGWVPIQTGGRFASSNNLVVTEENDITRLGMDINSNQFKSANFVDSVFIRGTGGFFDYDLHTTSRCNCADKGIYSGTQPFRDVPQIPYVFSRTITPSGNTLNIRVTAKAGSN